MKIVFMHITALLFASDSYAFLSNKLWSPSDADLQSCKNELKAKESSLSSDKPWVAFDELALWFETNPDNMSATVMRILEKRELKNLKEIPKNPADPQSEGVSIQYGHSSQGGGFFDNGWVYYDDPTSSNDQRVVLSSVFRRPGGYYRSLATARHETMHVYQFNRFHEKPGLEKVDAMIKQHLTFKAPPKGVNFFLQEANKFTPASELLESMQDTYRTYRSSGGILEKQIGAARFTEVAELSSELQKVLPNYSNSLQDMGSLLSSPDDKRRLVDTLGRLLKTDPKHPLYPKQFVKWLDTEPAKNGVLNCKSAIAEIGKMKITESMSENNVQKLASCYQKFLKTHVNDTLNGGKDAVLVRNFVSASRAHACVNHLMTYCMETQVFTHQCFSEALSSATLKHIGMPEKCWARINAVSYEENSAPAQAGDWKAVERNCLQEALGITKGYEARNTSYSFKNFSPESCSFRGASASADPKRYLNDECGYAVREGGPKSQGEH